MAAPAGVPQNRWNQLVRGLGGQAGISDADADAWLNAVWTGMTVGDEVQGFPDRRAALERWLVVNAPETYTLPAALRRWAEG